MNYDKEYRKYIAGWVLAGMWVVLIVIGMIVQANTAETATGEIKCSKLTIVDKNGKERAKVFVDGNLVGMEMVDENGAVRFITGVYSNAKGPVKSVFGIYGDDGRAKVLLMDVANLGNLGVFGSMGSDVQQLGAVARTDRLDRLEFRWLAR